MFVASSPQLILKNKGGTEVGTGSSLYQNDGSLSENGVAYRGQVSNILVQNSVLRSEIIRDANLFVPNTL